MYLSSLPPLFRQFPVLVVLQNAYDKGSLRSGYSFRRWFNEFERSRSGYRLATMFGWENLPLLHYTNTTPTLGKRPNARLKPDLTHLRRALMRVKPCVMVACGRQAERACLELSVAQDLFCIPHPAYRLLTDELLIQAGNAVKWRLILKQTPTYSNIGTELEYLRKPCVHVAFRQLPGKVVKESL